MSSRSNWVLAAAVTLLPASAGATNGLHPRTKVVWDASATCGIVVVRSEQSTVNLPYSLPDANEDGMLDGCDDDPTPDGCEPPIPNQPFGEDEVDTSRRHQFFAMCRQHPLDELLPNWITQPDVDVSAAVETCCDPNDCPGPMCPLIDPAILGEDDLLETDPSWGGCFERINEDDDRRPITVAQAGEGIDWDVSAVSPGVYAIEGYTWEPPFNLWSRRPGFVKVVDEAADAKLHPAAALIASEEEKEDDNVIDGCEKITLTGCVDAGDEATIDVFWRVSAPGEAIEWHRIIADEPAQNGNFELEWSPESLPSGTILLRVDVKDECGTYTAHAPFVMEVAGGEECEDGSVFMDGGDDGADDYTDDQDNRDDNSCVAGSGGDEGDDDGETGGCGCSSTSFAAGLPLLALFPLLARRRRTR